VPVNARRPTTRRAGAKAELPITIDAIVDTAFRMIDERGATAFSMRSLATELGVFPATIYWHVTDRAHLLGLVNERWISQLELPDDDLDWLTWMRQTAHRYRALAHRHPNVARLVTIERERNTDTLTVPDRLIGKLVAAGFDDELVHAYNACMVAAQGFVVMELAQLPDPDSGPEAVAEAEAELRALDAERFPHVAAHFDELADRAMSVRWSAGVDAPLDTSFDWFLDVVFAGLELKLAASRPTARRAGSRARKR
jgi:AcrR family transcriptional regulator